MNFRKSTFFFARLGLTFGSIYTICFIWAAFKAIKTDLLFFIKKEFWCSIEGAIPTWLFGLLFLIFLIFYFFIIPKEKLFK